jgi:hypothetical protein
MQSASFSSPKILKPHPLRRPRRPDRSRRPNRSLSPLPHRAGPRLRDLAANAIQAFAEAYHVHATRSRCRRATADPLY